MISDTGEADERVSPVKLIVMSWQAKLLSVGPSAPCLPNAHISILAIHEMMIECKITRYSEMRDQEIRLTSLSMWAPSHLVIIKKPRSDIQFSPSAFISFEAIRLFVQSLLHPWIFELSLKTLHHIR